MVPRLSLLFVALTSVLAVVTEFTNTTPHETKRPCPAIWDTAISVTTELQATQFNSSLGYYRGNRLWTDANTIEDIYNLMSLRNVNTWRDLIYQTPIGHMNLWDFYFNGSFDDAGWALLLYIRIRDFVGPTNGDFQKFEASTYQVYDYIGNHWTSDCGGGGEHISRQERQDSIPPAPCRF